MVTTSMLLLSTTGIAQAQMVEMSLNELSTGADSIIDGTVTDTACQWNAEHTHILTNVKISAREYLKGSAEQQITVTVPGGAVDDITEWVSDTPAFSKNEEVILFLTKENNSIYSVHGQRQGKFNIKNGKVGHFPREEFKQLLSKAIKGEQVQTLKFNEFNAGVEVQNATGGPNITSITPSTASAGTDNIVTINGFGFGETVGKVMFYYQGSSVDFNSVVNWSDTQITAKVPIGTVNGYPGSACSGPVTVQTSSGVSSNKYPFTVTFSYGGLYWPGENPIVNYQVNPNTSDCSGEEVAVANAAAVWSNVPNKDFTLNYAGTTSATNTGRNYNNEVMWGTGLSQGVLAQASMWSSTATGALVECDIKFNDTFNWSFATTTPSNAFDVQTILLHEMGHWLNLRDLYGNEPNYPQDTQKVMYGYGSTGETKRTLHPADAAGIQWIYPGSGPIDYEVSGKVTASDSQTNLTQKSITRRGISNSLHNAIVNATITAQPIEVGSTINGALSSTDQYLDEYDSIYYCDFYYFELSSTTEIAVAMNSSELDTWLDLFKVNEDSTLETLEYNDDIDYENGNTNSRIPVIGYKSLEPGLYVISAGSALPEAIGNYSLSLTRSNETPEPIANGLGGVKMSFAYSDGTTDDNMPGDVYTDSDGNWSQSGFAPDSIYKVTPTKQSYTFNPVDFSFSSENSSALNFNASTDLLKGDVNGDTFVNILDVVVLVDIVLGHLEPTPRQFYCANLCDDGEINILDVVKVVNIILSVES